MTLPFMITFPKNLDRIGGQPTNFVPKIWKGLVTNDVWMNVDEYLQKWDELSDDEKKLFHSVKPKLHSFRGDVQGLWKAGRLIHAVTNNRSPRRRQFIPKITCLSTQKIQICHYSKLMYGDRPPDVQVDDILITGIELERLVYNDGFDSVEDFFAYFNTSWTGKIIHYTDLKY